MKPNSVPSAVRGRPPRTALETTHMRMLITSAAHDLFAREGYSAVSIRRVAEAAGITPMTFYGYFDSKVDCLRHLWSDIFAGLFDSLDVLAAEEGNAKRRLLKVSRAYVRYWVDHPDHYRMVFMSAGISQPDVSVFVADDVIGKRFGLFRTCLATATKTEPAAASMRSQLLICSLQGIAHCHITISGYAWPEPEQLVDSLIAALCPATFASVNAGYRIP